MGRGSSGGGAIRFRLAGLAPASALSLRQFGVTPSLLTHPPKQLGVKALPDRIHKRRPWRNDCARCYAEDPQSYAAPARYALEVDLGRRVQTDDRSDGTKRRCGRNRQPHLCSRHESASLFAF